MINARPILLTPFIFLLSTSLLLACGSITQTSIPLTATFTPDSIPSPLPLLSPAPEVPDTGWQALQPGLERRTIRLHNDQNQHVESLYIFRLDQNQFRLDIAYHETPQSVEDWQTETNALMVVNGGFFQVEAEKHIPNGLTIINGQAFGSSYESFAGMLAIHEQGAEVRWLTKSPYNSDEVLWARQ